MLRQQPFSFDYAFPTTATNDIIYPLTLKPILEHVMSGGWGAMFAYGQTGTGKTYSMEGMYDEVCKDLFSMCLVGGDMAADLQGVVWEKEVWLGVFEIMGDKVYDLLNDKQDISILEDKFGEVQVKGLSEVNSNRERLCWFG
jgi:kinesin family protein 2/24